MPVADYQVVPLPQEITLNEGKEFVLNSQVAIVCSGDEAMQRNAEFLAEYVKEKTGLALAIVEEPQKGAITLAVGEVGDNAEGYRLTVNAEGVTITGASPAGVFYGIQTLRKALPVAQGGSIKLPSADICDYPRFGYRGAHLDVSRHFFAVDSIKSFIDMLALHNMINTQYR